MPARLSLAALVLLVAAFGPAVRADDDPIVTKLLADKEAFVTAKSKAKDDVLKAFDKLFESVKNNKTLKIDVQLAQLERIEAEKKAFDENDVVPTLMAMKTAMSDYRTVMKKAEAQCKTGFENAAKAYRDKNDLKAASATLEEFKEFLAKAPGTADGGTVISSQLSGKVFGVTGTGEVVTADYAKEDAAQLWRVVPAANGWAYVEHVKTGMVLTANGKAHATKAVIAKKEAGMDGQLWKTPASATAKDAIKFSNKESGRVLGIIHQSKRAGMSLILWPDEDTPSEWFAFSPPK